MRYRILAVIAAAFTAISVLAVTSAQAAVISPPLAHRCRVQPGIHFGTLLTTFPLICKPHPKKVIFP